MSSSIHANNKTKNILVLGEGIAQGLDDTTRTAEKNYAINFMNLHFILTVLK